MVLHNHRVICSHSMHCMWSQRRQPGSHQGNGNRWDYVYIGKLMHFTYPRLKLNCIFAQIKFSWLTRLLAVWNPTKQPNCFSLLFHISSSSDRLAHILSVWFLHTTTACYREQCTGPSLFYNFILTKWSKFTRAMGSSFSLKDEWNVYHELLRDFFFCIYVFALLTLWYRYHCYT